MNCITLHEARPRRSARLAVCSFLFFGLSEARSATIVAQWDFNDAANGSVTSVASTGGYVASGACFIVSANRTANGGGVSGVPGDYGFSMPTLSCLSTTPAFLAVLNAVAGTQALSVTFWYQGYMGFEGISPTSQVGLRAGAQDIALPIIFDTSGERLSAPLTPAFDQWHLLSFVYGGGGKQIYLDSTLVASGTGFSPLLTNFNSFEIGAVLGGQVDNFTLWNGALTAAEVAALAVKPVPEPNLAALLGMVGLLATARRRRQGPC